MRGSPPRLRSSSSAFSWKPGAALFAADLATRAFSGDRLFPFAAPIGGTAMIVSWFALAVVFAAMALRKPIAGGKR